MDPNETLFDDLIFGDEEPGYSQDLFEPESGSSNPTPTTSSKITKIAPKQEQEDEDEDEDEEAGFFDNEEEEEDDENSEENEDEENQESEADGLEESDTINDLLLAKGIKDPRAILYEAEDGTTEEIDFYSLSYSEQMSILKSDDREINYGLSENEVSTLNFLRENGVSFEDAIEYFKKEAVREYQDSLSDDSLKIDNYEDEELFVLDLKLKYEDLTEDQAVSALNAALQNPDLFKRQIDRLRDEYRDIEIKNKEARNIERLSKEKEDYDVLMNSLNEVAVNTEDIGGLDLTDEDKEEVMRYVLEKDLNGQSEFDKLKTNPDLMFKAAWFATKGQEAFDIVHSYYKNEIDKVRKSAYQKAKEDFEKKNNKATESTQPRKRTVIKKTDKAGSSAPGFRGYTTHKAVGSIDDLYRDLS